MALSGWLHPHNATLAGDTGNIGRDIKVIILEIRGSQVRLGIKAPDGMKILREEVLDTDNNKYPL